MKRAVLALVAFATATLPSYATSGEGIDLPETRAERSQYLFREQNRPSDAPGAPGGSGWDDWDQPPPQQGGVDLGRFTQFLRNALEQSQGKGYREGYQILKNSIIKARQAVPLPAGLDTAMQAIVDAGVEADGYESKRKVLRTALDIVFQQAGRMAGPPQEAFPALLELARTIGYGQGYQNGYVTRKKVLTTMQERRDLMPSPTHELFVRALVKAGVETDGYDSKGKVLKNALGAFLQAPQDPPVRAYLAAIREAGNGLGYKNGYFARKYLLLALRDRPDLIPGPLFRTTITAAITAGEKIDGYESKRKVLQKTADFLNQVGPRSDWKVYYRLLIDVGGGLGYKNSYFARKYFALALMESGAMDAFDRVSIETAIESATRANGYSTKTDILRQAFHQLL